MKVTNQNKYVTRFDLFISFILLHSNSGEMGVCYSTSKKEIRRLEKKIKKLEYVRDTTKNLTENEKRSLNDQITWNEFWLRLEKDLAM